MKYVLVSTYPKEGTQNIGDKLIEQCCSNAIRSVDPKADISAIWRASSWNDVKDVIHSSDRIVFACLAIRKNILSVYPYLENILNASIPFSVLSAGTALPIEAANLFSKGFTANDLDILKRTAYAAQTFTTRGVLSQAFCEKNGLHEAKLSGDIAFFDNRYDELKFAKTKSIANIAISDPHYSQFYESAFEELVNSLKNFFPNANIDCLLHGKNSTIKTLCDKLELKCHAIYQQPNTGLNIYDNYDLHVGFRIHGHVSALKRRIPSYLLEQDGRGTDYGLTFSRKISIPCYRVPRPVSQKLCNEKEKMPAQVTAAPSSIQLLSTIIAQDYLDGFVRFLGFETEINRFNTRNISEIKKICSPYLE